MSETKSADCFASVNGIRLHYLDHAGGEPALILLPGLTANANSFDGLVAAGLAPRFRVLALDLRGRGQTDQPPHGYSVADHAADVIDLLDSLGLDEVVLCGHSFGGLLALHLAAHYPERFTKLILIDASHTIHPKTREMIQPSLDRLGRTVPSVAAYLEAMKKAPFLDGFWDPAIESYFRADVEAQPDGTASARSRPETIAEVIDSAVAEKRERYIGNIRLPALMINALGPYGPAGAPPLVPEAQARATVAALPRCEYAQVGGNHVTMIFGENAKQVVEIITRFVES